MDWKTVLKHYKEDLLATRRLDGRSADQLRPITIQRGFTRYAEGSVLICSGETKVLCTASVEERVPMWMRGQGKGWLTAEYSLLPRATHTRTQREATSGRVGGRTHEIQRLIGRSLRACLDLNGIGERTLHVDCDVLQADGGTRTAAITGAFVATWDAVRWLVRQRGIAMPRMEHLAAVSVGLVEGKELLDLCYEEDSTAQVDMNVVALESGKMVEVQATAEGTPYDRVQLDRLLDLAQQGIGELVRVQKQAIASEPVALA